jgi:hypothetical protein
MSQHHLPTGCHDAESAALLLSMSKKALLKRMRELGWLNIGGDAHNQPRREFIQNGLLTTQERSYGLRGRNEISKTYRVMLLTQKGFQALKEQLNKPAVAAGAKAIGDLSASATAGGAGKKIAERETESPAPTEPVQLFNREKSEQAHKQYLEQLAELGIPVSRAS